MVGFNDSGSYAGGANKFTGFSYSTDDGATFTDGGTLPTNALGDAGDPILARDETTSRIYFATLAFASPGTIQVFRSDDNGVTWGAPGWASTDAPCAQAFYDQLENLSVTKARARIVDQLREAGDLVGDLRGVQSITLKPSHCSE